MSDRPFVLINVAATVDGKIDSFERRGAPISSDADRERVDRLRAEVDAVMIGGRTLLQEDPRLTVRSPRLRADRLARGEPENPAKIGVLSSLNGLCADGRFFTHGPARVMLFVPRGQAHQLPGAEVFECGAPRVDLRAALETLATLGMHRVLVEGGATLNFELLRRGLVDEVQVYVAPLIFGGAAAPTLAGGDGLSRQAAIALRLVSVEAEYEGVVLRYAVTRSEP